VKDRGAFAPHPKKLLKKFHQNFSIKKRACVGAFFAQKERGM
jgi:hypothetical protein